MTERSCLSAEARVVGAAGGGRGGAGGAGRARLVDRGGDEVAGLAVVTDQQSGEEPPRHLLCQPAAQPGGGGPHQLTVVPRGRGEGIAGHGAGRELGDLTEPGADGLGPLSAQVSRAAARGLVEVLTNTTRLRLSVIHI